MPEKEMDEVALRAPERRKRGWMAKEAAKDADKGWWFVTRQVKIFTLLDQNLFERENASHHETAWGPFRGQEWSLSLSSRN